MHRSTQLLTAIVAGLGVWFSGLAAQAGVIAIPPPGPARIAKADAVIVGKVESLEPMDIKVENTTYRIAIVKISQGLKGAKDGKTLKIGFMPIPKPADDGKGFKIIRTGARPVQLQEGQEGLFILKKNAKEDFYTIGGVIGYYINGDVKDFDKEVQTAKAIVKAADNPQAALKSKDAEERLNAAAILIDQYRTYRGPTSKLEPINAEESKQIMQTLADGDWQAGGDFRSLRPTAAQLFRQLGVTVMDGFVVPAGAKNYQAIAQTWVRENAQTYRIQRFVAADAK